MRKLKGHCVVVFDKRRKCKNQRWGLRGLSLPLHCTARPAQLEGSSCPSPDTSAAAAPRFSSQALEAESSLFSLCRLLFPVGSLGMLVNLHCPDDSNNYHEAL